MSQESETQKGLITFLDQADEQTYPVPGKADSVASILISLTRTFLSQLAPWTDGSP